jgi:curved DNA-binding protein CbpA
MKPSSTILNALKILELNETASAEEIRLNYKRLMMKHHPDRGGDQEAAKLINVAYEFLTKMQYDGSSEQAIEDNDDEFITSTDDDELNVVLSQITGLDGVVVELVGTWIWVSGNTFQHKEIFKMLGFKWGSKKKVWSWHKETDKCRSYKNQTMDEVKRKYGVVKVRQAPQLS